MANELQVAVSAAYSKSGLSRSIAKSLVATISGLEAIGNVQIVGTSNEQINYGDSAPGLVVIVNLDSTNYVEIFGDNMNMQKVAKLLPGQCLLTFLDGSTSLFGRANTAPCQCEVLAVDL